MPSAALVQRSSWRPTWRSKPVPGVAHSPAGWRGVRVEVGGGLECLEELK